MNKSLIKGIVICIFCFNFINVLFSIELSQLEDYKTPKFHVLMIANQDYKGQDLDLKYTINDIEVYKTIFRRLYKVPLNRISSYKNVELYDFISIINEFKSRVKKDELIVFIYAGHGNNNGMPIFADRKTIKPKLFYDFFNSFKNDTVIIMDSCYSGAEEGGNNILISDNSDNAYKQVGLSNNNKEVKERLRYRSNIIRVYSSLAHQQSREANYKQIKGMQSHLGSTYKFLEGLGYNGVGNGMFSIILAAFFSELDPNKNAYSFEDLNSHVNLKISDLQESGFDSQRPKMIPFQSPFKVKENFYLFYKNIERKKLPKIERLYYKAVLQQIKSKYYTAISLYKQILKINYNYKDVRVRLAGIYTKIGQAYGVRYPNKAIANLNKALEYNSNHLEANNTIGQIYLYNKKYRLALQYFTNVLWLSTNAENNYWIARSNNNIGTVYSYQGRFNKALSLFKKALNISKQNKDLYGISTANNNIGGFYIQRHQPKKAIGYFNKALKISEQINDSFGISSASNNIAMAYFIRRQYKKTLGYFKKALRIVKSLNKTKEIAMCQNNIARVHEALNEYDNAIKYYKSSAYIYRKEKDEYFLANNYNSIAMVYYKKKEYNKAYNYLKKTYAIRFKHNNLRAKVDILIEMAMVENERNNYNKSEELLIKAKKISTKTKYKEGNARIIVELMGVYDNLGKYYFKKREYKKSIIYLKKVKTIYELVKHDIALGRTYTNIGYNYYKQQKYTIALENINKAISKGLNTNDKSGLKNALYLKAKITNDMGVMYSKNNDYNSAIKYLRISLEIKKGLFHNTMVANTLVNIASIYEKLNKPNKALKHYFWTIELLRNKSAYNTMANVYFNIAIINYNKSLYNKSLKYFTKSLKYFNFIKNIKLEIKAKSYMAYSYNKLGEQAYNQNKYNRAIKYSKSSLAILAKIKNQKPILIEVYNIIALSYYHLKDYSKAISFQKKLIKIAKSINHRNIDKYEKTLKIIETQ